MLKTKLQEQYIYLLKKFFKDEKEAALYEVSEIGKELMRNKVGPDVLLELHSTALKSTIQNMDPLTLSKNLIEANDLLLHAIMAYAMNYYAVLELLDKDRQELADTNEKMTKLNKDLKEMNERLSELDRLKSLFIASMSHELRTPLNSIIGFTGILLMGLAGELNDEQKKQLTMVKNSSHQLLDLINDILDISKIESGKLELEFAEVDIEELCNEISDTFTPVAATKGLDLSFQVASPLALKTDHRRLRQIITNLVSNAIKYTDKGKITISASANDTNVIISISDTGRGIPADKFSQLFKPFSRLMHDSESNQSGTGLGLYLSQKLTIMLGGIISLRSQPGKGSTFSVELPFYKEQ